MIRPVALDDAEGIAAIYNHYVLNTVSTFEETAVSDAEMTAQIGKVKDKGLPWLVAQDGIQIAGYAHATPWHSRAAFRHTVEVTVYVSTPHVAKVCGYEEGRAL